MNYKNNRIDLKIVIVGDQNVGKTSLMQRYVHDSFSERSFSSIGAAFAAKEVVSKGQKKIIGIWDTAGQERYRAMAKIFFRDAKAAVVCYDLTSKSSWDELRSWVRELREVEENCKVYICGTKKDLVDDGVKEREVPEEKVLDYSRGIQVKDFETSSKTGEQVHEIFQQIIDDWMASNIDLKKNGAVILDKKPFPRSCCYLS